MSDDMPYLAADRDAHFRKVALVCAGILLSIVIAAVRCGDRHDRERDFQRATTDRLLVARAMRDYAAAQATAAASPPSDGPARRDAPPVELELVRGRAHLDVEQAPISLGDGRQLEISTKAAWTFAGRGLSLTHPPAVRVTTEGDTVRLTSHAATAELTLIATSMPAADALAEALRGYEASGHVEANAPTTLSLLGQKVDGMRLRISDRAVEVVAAPAGKRRLLLVVVAGSKVGADLTPLREIVETVTLGGHRPTAHFDVTLFGDAGEVIGVAEATLGKPFKIAGERMTINRRATVRAQRGGMQFEHSPELIVVASPEGVILRGSDAVIPLLDAPPAIPLDVLASSFAGELENPTPVTRAFAGTEYRGIAGQTTHDALTTQTLVFAFHRGERAFVVSVQSLSAEPAPAEGLLATVISTVR